MRDLIIYVDDDRDDLEIMAEAFAEIPDFRLVCMERPDNLLTVMEENMDSVCLVVLDVNMPVYGIDILSHIRNSPGFNQVPVVMISSSKSPKDRNAVEKLRSELLEKPSSFPEIRQLAEHLAKHCPM